MNGKLDVEVLDGRVVAVWLHCQLLPFEQHDIDEDPARQTQLGDDLAALNPTGRLVTGVSTEPST